MKRCLFFVIFLKIIRIIPFSRYLYKKLIKKLKFVYHYDLIISKASFKNLNTIELKGFELKPLDGSFSMALDICLSVRLTQLVLGNIRFEKFELQGSVILSKPIGETSYKNSKTEVPNLEKQLKKMYDFLFKRLASFLKLLPQTLFCNELKISINSGNEAYDVSCTLKLLNNHYNLTIKSFKPEITQTFHLYGDIDLQLKEYSISVYCDKFDASLAPSILIQQKIKFQFLQSKIIIKKTEESSFIFRTIFLIDKISINEKEIVDRLSIFLNGYYNVLELAIDDSSSILFNKLEFPFLISHYFKNDGDIITGQLLVQECTTTEILESFRYFSLKELYGFTSKGTLSLHFSIDFFVNNPFKYNFDIEFLDGIVDYSLGDLNFNYLKEPFEHSIIGHGNTKYILNLSSRSTHYAPLKKISKHLKNVVVLVEDKNFYKHRGIDSFFLGYAFIINLVNRKYTRGGSTITMQLSRNLFLNHEKTIFRKLEEIIIAYTMENIFMVSKDRILEIYLNVIEYGKGVYGIGQATNFYFTKKPINLTLTESLVISYIIPRPKFFLDAIKAKSPTLRKNLKNHISLYSTKMLDYNIITEFEFSKINYRIEFSKEIGVLDLT